MNKWLIAGATAAGLVISSAAMARVDVGISIGVPGVVYPAAPVVAPPPPCTWRRPSTRRPRLSITGPRPSMSRRP